MEQRETTRIHVPLVVEVTHPSLGTIRTTAKDISAGGVFIGLQAHKLSVGAKLRVRLMGSHSSDTQTSPTVEMKVAHVAEEGLGLAFVNRTAEHLWRSVERLREELQIGQDYFQVYQCAVITHIIKGVLVVQKHGKWMFPGHYLVVGENPKQALELFVNDNVGISDPNEVAPIKIDGAEDVFIPEAATYTVYFHMTTQQNSPTLDSKKAIAGYKDWRWVNTARDANEITFATEQQRRIAASVLQAQLINTEKP